MRFKRPDSIVPGNSSAAQPLQPRGRGDSAGDKICAEADSGRGKGERKRVKLLGTRRISSISVYEADGAHSESLSPRESYNTQSNVCLPTNAPLQSGDVSVSAEPGSGNKAATMELGSFSRDRGNGEGPKKKSDKKALPPLPGKQSNWSTSTPCGKGWVAEVGKNGGERREEGGWLGRGRKKRGSVVRAESVDGAGETTSKTSNEREGREGTFPGVDTDSGCGGGSGGGNGGAGSGGIGGGGKGGGVGASKVMENVLLRSSMDLVLCHSKVQLERTHADLFIVEVLKSDIVSNFGSTCLVAHSVLLCSYKVEHSVLLCSFRKLSLLFS